MTEKRASPFTARSVVGILIIAFGVLLTLDNLGFVRFDDLWQLWPVALLLIGVSKLSQREWGGGFVWLALGTAFLLPLVIEDFEIQDLWDYWPLMLIAFGVSMVLRSFSRSGGPGSSKRAEGRRDRPDDRQSDDKQPGEIRAFGFFSTVRRNVTAVFRHGDLTAILGGCHIDLTRAELPPEGAVVEVFAFWGGVELRIPKDWVVDPQLAVMMGAIEDNTDQLPGGGGGRLTIKGVALMGGFEIRN